MDQILIKKKQGGVVEVLKDAILSGIIPANTEVTQNDLAQSLGVSRMPVREALILLEYQGLVKRLPNNRILVAELSKEYLHKMFQLCIHVEMEALQRHIPPAAAMAPELEFHRSLYREYPYGFQKKIMETLTEIYIRFALNCRSYDTAEGEGCIYKIKEAVSKGEVPRASEIYDFYFDKMTSAIMEERIHQK